MTRTPFEELAGRLRDAVALNEMTPTQLSELATDLVTLTATGLAKHTERVRDTANVDGLRKWTRVLLSHAQTILPHLHPVAVIESFNLKGTETCR